MGLCLKLNGLSTDQMGRFLNSMVISSALATTVHRCFATLFAVAWDVIPILITVVHKMSRHAMLQKLIISIAVWSRIQRERKTGSLINYIGGVLVRVSNTIFVQLVNWLYRL